MSRRRWLLVAAALATGVALRAAFLFWSPLPATLDGFKYARLADHLVRTGDPLGPGILSDEILTTVVLGIASELTGVPALRLAQPLAACVGGASVLAAVVLVRGLGRSFGWPARRTRHASVLAALGLAVGGLYLRRTGVPDEEALGLLLLPLFVLAAHRGLASRRPAWGVVVAVLALVYPPLHNLSSVAAAFALSALAVSHVTRATTPGELAAPVGLTAGFWAYVLGYFAVAERLGLGLTYSGLLRDHPGAFLAWVVVLVVGAAWLPTASRRAVRATVGVGFATLFVVVAANAVAPVFPGTVTTPPLVLGLTSAYVVPAALATWVLPSVLDRDGDAPAVVALLVGPLALVWFTLVTSPTPEFFDAVQRAQVQVHVAAFVLAAVAAVGTAARRPAAGRALVAALVLASVVTAPLAFVHLDTGTYPRTIHASEFEATTVALSAGTYASDHRLSRAAPLYYGGNASGVVGPTHTWLAGGPPPGCPTVAQRSWTTSGAHFFPTAPLTLAEPRLDRWLARNDLVYSVGGVMETYVVLPSAVVPPPNGTRGACGSASPRPGDAGPQGAGGPTELSATGRFTPL